MNEEAWQAKKHALWLEQGHKRLRKLGTDLRSYRGSYITRGLLMLLAMERSLMEDVRQALHNLPTGIVCRFYFELSPSSADHDCQNPPSAEELLATATELSRIVSSCVPLKRVGLRHATDEMTAYFLAVCSRLDAVSLRSCPLVAASVQSLFSFSITTLRHLEIDDFAFQDPDSIHAFVLGIKTVRSLTGLFLFHVSFPPEYQEQVALTVARCKKLEYFSNSRGVSQSFCEYYTKALSKNVDTKLEYLALRGQTMTIDLGRDRDEVSGLDATVEADIRLVVGFNIQRRTCGPLFAAIGDATTDTARRQCLVQAFLAAGCL